MNETTFGELKIGAYFWEPGFELVEDPWKKTSETHARDKESEASTRRGPLYAPFRASETVLVETSADE